MINHLSPDQFSSLMIRAATSDERQHVAACAECAAKLDGLKDTMSVFRDSVRRWAVANDASAVPARLPVQRQSSSVKFRPLRWIAVATALILLIAAPVYKRTNDQRQVQAIEDTQLLEQVNEHLLRNVPEPMEPLMQLLSNASVQEVGGRQ